MIAAFMLCASVLGSNAQTASDQQTPPAEQAENPCATKCVPQKARKIVGWKEVTKRVPIYAKAKAGKKDVCCAKPVETQPVTVTAPAPQTVYVKKQIVIVEVPEYIHAPSPPITVVQPAPTTFVQRRPVVVAPQPSAQIIQKMVCCPPGVNVSGLPPCKPGQISNANGNGTVGGGYVVGAPRNKEECAARGGTDTGRGCDGWT
jgi:hypothetical protein